MRGITLALMAVLAMTSVAWATPVVTIGDATLSYTIDSVNPDGDLSGFGAYRVATVKVTGTNINLLSDFTITGNVGQVWSGPTTQSDWLGNGSASSSEAMDSYVKFATHRFPDYFPPLTLTGTADTTETNDFSIGPETGLGTLTNSKTGEEPDAYVRLIDEYTPGVEETLDLFRLVIPDGQSVSVAVNLKQVDYNVETGYYTTLTDYEFSGSNALTVYSFDGDCNMDGFVDGIDGANFATGWFGTPDEWATGDFNGDGVVDGTDGANFANAWFGPWGTGYTGEAESAPIPEPATLVMLVLGSLCLAGYRLRK